MLNHIVIMGRLVADPDLRTTPSGVTVATMRLAVDRDFKNKQTGERETDFINVVAWRQTAEFVSRFFTKGRMAVVEGRLQIRQYVDKEGNKRTAAEVVADNVYFGDSRRDGDAGNYAPHSSNGGYTAPPPAPAAQPSAGGYGAPAAGGYTAPATGGYAAPAGGDQFAELSDDDGDLPF